MARVMRLSSPPEAILASGFGGSPGVGGDVKFDAVLPVAGQRSAAVPQAEAHPRHIQKVQRVRDAAVQLLKGFQAGLGQGLGGPPAPDRTAGGFSAWSRSWCSCENWMRSSSSRAFSPKSQHVLHGVAVFPFELVDQVQPLLDLIQLGVVALVVLQTGGKFPREVLDGVVQVQQLAGGRRPGRCPTGPPCRWALEASPSRSTPPAASSPPERAA